MTAPEHKLPLREKIGYALGDAAANLVWRGALAFLMVFYTDVFGISAAAAGLLLLIVRLSDGVTDVLMGMVADRTKTRWGKFRPWILWSTPVLALFMILAFTTPDFSETGKLVWAYVTYIGLILAYTANNVPYSALMGVMTPDHQERSVLSGFRFAGAFFGGILMTGFLLDLVEVFGDGNQQQGYQYSMYLFATLLIIMMVITFLTTRERVPPPKTQEGNLKQDLFDLGKNLPLVVGPLLAIAAFFYQRDLTTGIILVVTLAVSYHFVKKLLNRPRDKTTGTQRDLVDLVTNVPWVILLCIGFLFNMFNSIKQGSVAYYFKHFAGHELMAGKYLIALLVVSMIAALITGHLTKIFGKKMLFIGSMILSGVLTGFIYFLGPDQTVEVFILGCAAEFFAAILPVLFFTMLGDSADFSEWQHGRRATGLVYSAGTFVMKTGGGFAGALIGLVLAIYGYDGMDKSTIEGAIPGIKALMSWIPMLFVFVAAAVMMLYPLTKEKMEQIEADLAARRES